MDTGGCSITPAPGDQSGLAYDLAITDLAECGVLVRNGFLSVRVWFPAARGVLTSSDQEVIIMCKPPGVTQPPVTSSGRSCSKTSSSATRAHSSKNSAVQVMKLGHGSEKT